MEVSVIRLLPDQDLRNEITRYAKENKISAGVILTCVGSLKKAVLRLADTLEIVSLPYKYEIVSLVGTFEDEDLHLHLSIADKKGRVIGGHLKEGCIIDTTAEIALGTISDLTFTREIDNVSGFNELKINKK